MMRLTEKILGNILRFAVGMLGIILFAIGVPVLLFAALSGFTWIYSNGEGLGFLTFLLTITGIYLIGSGAWVLYAAIKSKSSVKGWLSTLVTRIG